MDFIIMLWSNLTVRLIVLLGGIIGLILAHILNGRRATDEQKIYLGCAPDEIIMRKVCELLYAIAIFTCFFVNIDYGAFADYSVTIVLIEIGGGLLFLHISLAISLLLFYAFLRLIYGISERSENQSR